MTVQATVDSTLNGQSADLILIEDAPDGARRHETKSLSGGSENFVFTGLDGGLDKEYTAKIVPSTSDVTQTAEIQYGASVEIDPIPHRDTDAANQIRETAEFNNGVAANNLGLGDKPLINGLLTSALNDGEVLADDGYVYGTIQAAQDAASSWIFIGPGTFNESVTVDTPGLTVQGSGHDTLIDGGTSGDGLSANAANISILSLRARTTSGQGTFNQGIAVQGSSVTIKNVTVTDSDNGGILTDSTDTTIKNSTILGGDDAGIQCTDAGSSMIVDGCFIDGTGGNGANYVGIFPSGGDCIISNNIVINSDDYGIRSESSDNILIANRIDNSTGDAISIGGSDTAANNIVANNRISNTGGANIDDQASGTVLDANNTS
jgi:hypothetical protein